MTFKPKRRKLLTGTMAAAALCGPAVARAQGPIVIRLQSAWPAKSLFQEFALDYAKKVNDMTGAEVRVEVLAVGSVVPAFGLLDAVSNGALDGAHGLIDQHYSRHQAFALWSVGPAFGMDANMLLAWHRYGGGRELLAKLYAAIGANVVSFPYGPMPTEPLGWFKKPINSSADFNGLKFRTVGMAIDIFAGLGAQVNALPAEEIASALERGVLDGAEYNNVSSDRMLGLAQAAKVCMLQSYHQSAAQFEILLNRTKFEALPSKIRAILQTAAEAASADMSWKAIDRYSKDYLELREKHAVRMLRTPDSVLQAQLAAYDAASQRRKDPMFVEIRESQRRFAERSVRWQLDTLASPRMAYSHYFGRKPATKPAAKKKR